MIFDNLIGALEKKGVLFEQGLSENEILKIESHFQITFPQEIRSFYKKALPVSSGFYPWRHFDNEKISSCIQEALIVPVKEIIESSDEIDWCENWGQEPKTKEGKRQRLSQLALNAPPLIPIWAHRYAVTGPKGSSPIVSVMGSDIIFYGTNLVDYLATEFHLDSFRDTIHAEIPYIPFWSDIIFS